jgi:hypothetical protein
VGRPEHTGHVAAAEGGAPGNVLSSAGLVALDQLRARIRRACEAGLLGDRDVDEVTLQVNALGEGIANVELRGMLHRVEAEPWSGMRWSRSFGVWECHRRPHTGSRRVESDARSD